MPVVIDFVPEGQPEGPGLSTSCYICIANYKDRAQHSSLASHGSQMWAISVHSLLEVLVCNYKHLPLFKS